MREIPAQNVQAHIKTRLLNLLKYDQSQVEEALVLKSYSDNQNANDKKQVLILAKLIADYSRFLKTFKPHAQNKSLANSLESNIETLFKETFSHLEQHYPDANLNWLMTENFFDSKNDQITDEERDKILYDELQMQCAIAKIMGQNEVHKNTINALANPGENRDEKASLYAESKNFVQHATGQFISYPDPIMQTLQISIVETLGKVAGTTAKFNALDLIEVTDTIQNSKNFILAETERFRTQFGSFWGFFYPNDVTTLNTALKHINDLTDDNNNKQKAASNIRESIKGLSWGAKHLTRAASRLQNSFTMIISSYLNAQSLSEKHLLELPGIFLELPFSNKQWDLTYELLIRNFSKLSYENKLKVIQAAIIREEKKKQPTHIVTRLIWQAWASKPAEYENKMNIGKNDDVSLKELNDEHYKLIQKHIWLENKRKDYLSDLPELFDYNTQASKIEKPNNEKEINLNPFTSEEKPWTKNPQEITTLMHEIDGNINNALKKNEVDFAPDSPIKYRLEQLERKYKQLQKDQVQGQELEVLRKLIEQGKFTLELEGKREHILNNPPLSIFYNELLRILTITLGSHRLINSGKIQRLHLPTACTAGALDIISSFVQIPVVSGVLAGAAKAIETIGSFKLKQNSDILSKITTTNTQMEYLAEQITIMLTLHLQAELKIHKSESVKNIAHFCQDRFVALMLMNADNEEWKDLDKSARKYVNLITRPIQPEDSIIEKAKMLFHKIKTSGLFRLKTLKENIPRKTVEQVVTEKEFDPNAYDNQQGIYNTSNRKNSKNLNSRSIRETPVKNLLLGAVPGPAVQADLKNLGKQVVELREALEAEKENRAELEKEVARISDENVRLNLLLENSSGAVNRHEKEESIPELTEDISEASVDTQEEEKILVELGKLTETLINDPQPQPMVIELMTPKLRREESDEIMPISESQNLNKNLVELVNKFNEILDSEETFSLHLKGLSDSFNNSENTSLDLKSLIGEKNFGVISHKIKSIEFLSQNPLSALTKIILDPPLEESQLLNLIKKQLEQLLNIVGGDLMRTRAQHIRELNKDLKEIVKFSRDRRWSALFDSFSKTAITNPLINTANPGFIKASLRFNDVYTMPAQRFSRYVLFFDDMAKQCQTYLSSKAEIPESINVCINLILKGKGCSHALTKFCEPDELEGYTLFQVPDNKDYPQALLNGKIYYKIIENNFHYKVADPFGIQQNGSIPLKTIAQKANKSENEFDSSKITRYLPEILEITAGLKHTAKPKDSKSQEGTFTKAVFKTLITMGIWADAIPSLSKPAEPHSNVIANK